MWINSEYRPLSWPIAVMIGFGNAGFVMGKMEEIARKNSATKAGLSSTGQSSDRRAESSADVENPVNAS
jgi:hypothetical protein